MKILLHVCCGPCSLGVIDRVLEDGEPTLYFYNPNIYPSEEFEKRRDTLKEIVIRKYPTLPVVSEKYDESEFLSRIIGFEGEPEGGKRCDKCIELRMERAAKYALEHGFDAFTTTLSVSPHKSYPLINSIGKMLESELGIKFIDTDFKKKDGFLKSTKLSKEMGIYRQNYCGCRFSISDERN